MSRKKKTVLRRIVAPMVLATALAGAAAAPASATSPTAPIEFTITNGQFDFEQFKKLFPNLGKKVVSEADKATIAALEAENASLDKALFALRGTISMHERNIANMEQQLGGMTVEEVRAKKAALETEVADLQEAVNNGWSIINRARGEVKTLRHELKFMKRSYTSVKALADANPDNEPLQATVQQLEAAITSVNVAIAEAEEAAETARAAHEQNKADLKQKRKELQAVRKLGNIANQIDMHRAMVNKLKDQAAEKEAKVAANTAEIARLSVGTLVDGYTIDFNGKITDCGKPNILDCYEGTWNEKPIFAEPEAPEAEAPEAEAPEAEAPADASAKA